MSSYNYDQVAELVRALQPHVQKSQMFGMPVLKTAGKAFAGSYGQDMNFKLSGEDHTRALALQGAHLFDPMGGRPMKEWVVVPEAQSEQWPSLAEAGLAYVESLLARG